jgi:D-alanine transaminase
MVEDGHVTEGASSSAFIITADRRVITRPLSNAILPGITRRSVMALAGENGLMIEERLFTVEEAHAAAEAFLTSASQLVMPIVKIDGKPVADGRPGALTRRLRALYLHMGAASAAVP